jgi:O-acetyl-ADP-ribose deacetylase (regulator of RNase III)
MTVEKIAMNGVFCAAYYLIAAHKKYLPIRALRIQAGAFALSLLAKEVLCNPKTSRGLDKSDLVPYVFVTASLYWTVISKKAQCISTAVLGTVPVLIGQPRTTPHVPPTSHRRREPLPPYNAHLPEGVKIGSTQVEAVIGDILDLPVEAIVNAANEILLGGGGIDGIIHKAAGPQLKEACRKFPLLPQSASHRIIMGDAVVTPSFNLTGRDGATQYIVHTVGPRASTPGGEAFLANAYRNSLAAAKAQGIRSIAFPAISVGEFHYPFEKAQKTAFETVKAYLEMNTGAFDTVVFVYHKKDIRETQEASIHAAWQEKITI